MNYTLNQEAAKSADSMNSRIEETGKYIGMFTRAEAVTSEKGSIGIDLSFKSDDGQTADYLSVWTHNGDNKEIYGFKQLMAMMTCLRLKNISKTRATIDKYDKAAQAKIKVEADVYQDLMGKRIGLLLQREEYLKRDGTVGNKLNIAGMFDADSELTASEILGKKTSPELLAKMVMQLKDRPLPANQRSSAPTHNAVTDPFDTLSDDIPF